PPLAVYVRRSRHSPAPSALAAKSKSPLSSDAQKSTPFSFAPAPSAAACERRAVRWNRVGPACAVAAALSASLTGSKRSPTSCSQKTGGRSDDQVVRGDSESNTSRREAGSR